MNSLKEFSQLRTLFNRLVSKLKTLTQIILRHFAGNVNLQTMKFPRSNFQTSSRGCDNLFDEILRFRNGRRSEYTVQIEAEFPQRSV